MNTTNMNKIRCRCSRVVEAHLFKGKSCPKCQEYAKNRKENEKGCLEDGCNVIYPSYGIKNTKNGLYCIKHKKEGMIDVKHKKCNLCGERRASYGISGTKKGLYCATCAKKEMPDMIDVTHKKCQFDGCNIIGPSFGYKESKGQFCSEHKKMI